MQSRSPGFVKDYGLDGDDVDYETGNFIAQAPTILAAVPC